MISGIATLLGLGSTYVFMWSCVPNTLTPIWYMDHKSFEGHSVLKADLLERWSQPCWLRAIIGFEAPPLYTTPIPKKGPSKAELRSTCT